jgi:hypothetical protein
MSAAKIPHRRPVRSGKNSTVGEKTAERIHAGVARAFGGRKVINIVAVFAALFAVAGGIFWLEKVYINPEHVFWSMVDNNLSTSSITKSTKQSSSGNVTKELTELAFTSIPAAHDVKEVTATDSNGTSRIKVESIGTPTDTYQRYLLIDQPAKSGKSKANYNKIYAMWLKNGGNAQMSNAQLFNNATFSAFLFGNLSPQQRSELTTSLKKAYSVDLNNVVKQKSHGRRSYHYKVSMSLKGYAYAARSYAKDLGLPNASQIDPNNYQASDKVALDVTVDVLSRQLRQVVYTTNSAVEDYSSYGILSNFKVPAHTVSYNTLQQAVRQAVSK